MATILTHVTIRSVCPFSRYPDYPTTPAFLSRLFQGLANLGNGCAQRLGRFVRQALEFAFPGLCRIQIACETSAVDAQGVCLAFARPMALEPLEKAVQTAFQTVDRRLQLLEGRRPFPVLIQVPSSSPYSLRLVSKSRNGGMRLQNPLRQSASPLSSATTRRRDLHAATTARQRHPSAVAWMLWRKPQSGHCGLPLGFADVATLLYQEFLKFDAADPNWPDRDRADPVGGPRLDAALLPALPDRLSGD